MNLPVTPGIAAGDPRIQSGELLGVYIVEWGYDIPEKEWSNFHVWLGTNAFFFEEGTAERFNGARYGEFRVDRTSGEAVLVGLRNDRLAAL